MGRLIKRRRRLGLPFEEVSRRIAELEKERADVREQLAKLTEKGTWSDIDDERHDSLQRQLSAIGEKIIQEKESYSLHIEEELRDSTKTLNKLTVTLIVVTIILATLTTLLYFKTH